MSFALSVSFLEQHMILRQLQLQFHNIYYVPKLDIQNGRLEYVRFSVDTTSMTLVLTVALYTIL